MQQLTSTEWASSDQPEQAKTSEHHPMFGCRRASNLLCRSGLRKCNRIKTFRVFKNPVRAPPPGKKPVFGPETGSPELIR
jgi:arginyl-tRNA--protein-N-Asp/Glu arginylyltransferase